MNNEMWNYTGVELVEGGDFVGYIYLQGSPLKIELLGIPTGNIDQSC